MTAVAAPPVHDLLLALAGRLDDDLLAWARELLAVGEEGQAVELATAALAAERVALPPTLRAALVAAARGAYADLDVDRALPPPAEPGGTPHRFDAAAAPGDAVIAALAAVPGRRISGCTLHLTWRCTPAGSAPGPLPRAVVLVAADPDRSADVLAYLLATELDRAGAPASVEVFTAGAPLPAYHVAALRSAREVTPGVAGRHGTSAAPPVFVGPAPDDAGPGPAVRSHAAPGHAATDHAATDHAATDHAATDHGPAGEPAPDEPAPEHAADPAAAPPAAAAPAGPAPDDVLPELPQRPAGRRRRPEPGPTPAPTRTPTAGPPADGAPDPLSDPLSVPLLEPLLDPRGPGGPAPGPRVPEPTRPEPPRAEPTRREPPRAEPTRPEPPRAEPSRHGARGAEPRPVEPERPPPSPPAPTAPADVPPEWEEDWRSGEWAMPRTRPEPPPADGTFDAFGTEVAEPVTEPAKGAEPTGRMRAARPPADAGSLFDSPTARVDQRPDAGQHRPEPPPERRRPEARPPAGDPLFGPRPADVPLFGDDPDDHRSGRRHRPEENPDPAGEPSALLSGTERNLLAQLHDELATRERRPRPYRRAGGRNGSAQAVNGHGPDGERPPPDLAG